MFKELIQIARLARRIARALSRREKWFLLLSTATMIVGSILTNLPAVVLGLLVNDILDADIVRVGRATPYLAIVAAALLGRQVLEVLRRYLVEKTATGVERDTRHVLLERLTRLPLNYYQVHRTGEISGRVNRGVEGYVRIIKLAFMDLLPACTLAGTAAAAAMTRHVGLGLLMLCVVPTGMAIVLLQIRSEKGIRLDIKATKEKMDGTTLEILNGVEPIRAIAAEDHVVAELDQDLDRVRHVELRHHLRMSFFDAAKFTNEGIFQIGVLTVAVVLAGRGSILPGDILTSALLLGSILAPLRELHRILDEAHESTLHAADVFTILDEPLAPEFARGVMGTEASETTGEALTCGAVTFSYNNEDGPVVCAVSLDIPRGEFVGICGASRSGKSTLLRLLAGVYAPDGGQVRVLGRELCEVAHADRAAIIGYVPQAVWLFNNTVAENITCGFPADLAQVAAAARLAQIHDEIEAMPQGYATIISERGQSLSGGQRQRLAIARALVRQPLVLLLDEATSALDNVTERRVMAGIESLPDLTVVAVAHRLTTLRNADRIVVMDNGELVESGEYDTLLSNGGVFAELVLAAEQDRNSGEAA